MHPLVCLYHVNYQASYGLIRLYRYNSITGWMHAIRISAAYGIVRCLSRVCHVRVLCRNGYRYGQSCYGILIGNYTCRIRRCHFECP